MAKQKTSSFKGKVSRNAAKQKMDASFSYLMYPKGVEILIAEPGTIDFDILPYIVTSEVHPDRDDEVGCAVPGELWYRRSFKVHRSVGVDEETVICLTSIGENCPICEFRNKMKKEEGANKDDIKALYPRERCLYVVMPFHKKWDEEPHIFDISSYLFQDLLNDELEDNEENEIFPDLEEGKTLEVRFERSRFKGQKFAKANRIDFNPRDYIYTMEDVEDLPNLDEIVEKSVISYKELERKFMSFDNDEDNKGEEFEEVTDEEESGTRKKKSLRKPRKKVNDEDDQEEEVPEEEEPEEEEKSTPMTRSRKTTSKKSTPPAKKKCPHGHKFGVDHDEFDDCVNCKLWDDCNEAAKEA